MNNMLTANPWFPGLRQDATAPVKLICFSHAGGTPSVYRDWPWYLADRVQVVPVLLPGRGLRQREKPYRAIEPLVGDVTAELVAAGLADNYALFGHSMGALVAYEVACELRRLGQPEPLHLFVSGSKAPHLYKSGMTDTRLSYMLPFDQLWNSVRDLGGTGASEAMGAAYFERGASILRADLQICDTYQWVPRRPLRCPMTAYSAAEDTVAPAYEVEGWRSYTYGSLIRRHLPGNHFFVIGESRFQLLCDVRAELDRLSADRELEYSARN